MTTNTRALLATRLLYPEHRTKTITRRMQDRLAAQQQRASDWPRSLTARCLRVVYRLGRHAGLTPAEARAQAHASVSDNLPF